MSKMKDYLIDLEDRCVEAIMNGAVSDEDVFEYVNTNGRGALLLTCSLFLRV